MGTFNVGLGKFDWINTLICPSRFMMSMALKSGISPERLVVIPNSIDETTVTPSREDGAYYLYLGRLSREKGILTLIEAFTTLSVPLVIAGDGPLRTACEEKADNAANIRLVGRLEGAELSDCISRSRCLIVPSEWYENAPMVALEAAASGKAIIAARIGGIPEIVLDGRTGLLFEPGMAEDLRDRVRQMEESAGKRKAFGLNARSLIEAEFSLSRHYDRLLDAYVQARESA